MSIIDQDNSVFTLSERLHCKGGCGRELDPTYFDFKKSGDRYKHCNDCREKKKDKGKDKIDENNISSDINHMNDKKKRENRPNISLQKQQIILKEQNYKCRGPGKDDNNEYECLMNVYNIKFSDKKASEPQFDHIIRWKEGGNDLKNIQALCACCHLQKTSMENIINENGSCSSERVNIILGSLTKPKYNSVSDSESDDDEYDELFTSGRRRRNIEKNYFHRSFRI